MKTTNIHSTIKRIAILTTTVIALPFASATDPVTNGFAASADREFVEVNLDRSLIELAIGVVGPKEPALAAMLDGIDRVNVRVVGLDESNRSASLERVDEIRRTLASEGWNPIASVSEGKTGDNVSILARMVDDIVTGLVITVIESEDEIVVVDISGQIRTEQIADLVGRLKIEGLDGLSGLLEEA